MAIYKLLLRLHPGNRPKYDMSKVPPREDSPFAGRKLLFLGSSVTYGECSLQEGIPEYFAARFGAEVTKEAVSGTTLTDDDDGSYLHRLLTRVDSKTDYRLFVCQLSTNDAAKKKPLGEIAAGFSPEDFDTKTVTGAIEAVIAYVKKTWDCPVVFYTSARYRSRTYPLLVSRLRELADKWEIGILDLWSGDAFNTISEKDRKRYMADPVHPTKAGYREWWCPELEKQLLRYLQNRGS